jgi:hypothetical protein
MSVTTIKFNLLCKDCRARVLEERALNPYGLVPVTLPDRTEAVLQYEYKPRELDFTAFEDQLQKLKEAVDELGIKLENLIAEKTELKENDHD